MIKKILVANRSEIACRIIKACKEMDIKTVAVYSEADKNSLHVQLADESVLIGPPQALSSYLKIDNIIKAAKDTNCDAIHPGYGFLAENSDFNEIVRNNGLIFIGPSPKPMKLLGSKVESRQLMFDAGVPLVPGMRSCSLDYDLFETEAGKIGYPVLIKASAGGGGKGMRIVRTPEELKAALESAIRESKSAFGSEDVYLEKYIESPRHVEFQIAADHFGNAVYVFERECSIQRRHQKIIEESPSPVMDPALQKRMGETAVQVIKASGYDSVGTVEFLVDKNKNFYFLEVNARIQVEHPVTELVSGIDLLKLQINISNDLPLPFKQEDLRQNGHAIECRIYAEDPDKNFIPSIGKILYLREPTGPGIRYDCGIFEGGEVTPFYDPILAKLIVWGKDRNEAIIRMLNALKQNIIVGIKTSIPFMMKVIEHPEFVKGNTFTNFIEANMSDHSKTKEDSKMDYALAAATLFSQINKKSKIAFSTNKNKSNPWSEIGGWEIGVGS